VKAEFEKITKEVNILIKKAKHIRTYNYTTEQNLEPIEGALEGLQESLVAYEDAAKGANNTDHYKVSPLLQQITYATPLIRLQ
jgi:hypothetical protein